LGPSRRRLLLLINRLTPLGGAERQLLHLARGLAANGHAVTLCCIEASYLRPAELEDSGVELLQLGITGARDRARAVPLLTRMARRAEVVHCTMWDPSLWGRLAAILARRPVVVADHATDRSVQISADGEPRGAWIARHNRLLDGFTFATVACAASQRPLLLGEGVSPSKLVQIPNGVPIAGLRGAREKDLSRGDLGLPESGPIVLQVGVFRSEKNQLGALAAFERVREEVPGAQLAFVGDGPMRAEVEARAGAVGASSWAHFLGSREDVPALLDHADLLLLPSTSDALPMTVLEAMAVGTPVLASDVGDVREALGAGGICVPAGDEAKLAEQCVRLLGDPALRERLSRAGAERAPSFDAATMVRRYEALFEAAREGGDPIAAVAGAG
jgi:glycosyltransferase involved in cell wall biosynthesis